jgi:glutamyl-tRNA synthetase
MHQTLAIKLLKEKKAFLCICTPKETDTHKEKLQNDKVDKKYIESYNGMCIDTPYDIDALKEEKTPFVIRIKQPELPIIHHDLIQGNISTAPNEIDSFIILNSDGTPTENFASACDDMLSGITMIIREDTHLLDTAKQIHIKEQLGYDAKIDYVHIPSISNCDDTSSVKWLFEQGYIPNAIINYLLLLGNDETPKEIFTLPEAIEWFNLENISNSDAKFDSEKLRFINREHLRMMEDKQLSSLFGFADADVGKLVKLYLEEASTINELASKIRPIFAPKVFEGKWKEEMQLMQKIIENAPMIKTFDAFKSYIIKESGLEDKNFSTPLRLLLTGAENGPELCDIYPLIKAYLLEVAS